MMEEQYDFSVDVGRYLETLIRQRWFIFGAAVACVAAAVFGVFIVPKSYEARALVASIKSESTVSFGSAIQTLSEEALLASGSGAYRIMDPDARLNSYVQLIKNPAIAQDVLEEVGDQLPEESRSVTGLLGMVDGDVASGSDTIEIVATSSDPQEAALIANAWAEAYTRHVNAIYSTGSTEGSYNAIQQQAADAEEKYETAQNTLVEFENSNRIDELNRQIGELEKVIESLSGSQVLGVRSVLSDTVRVENLIRDARDMRDQVRQGGSEAAASNALAITLLKAQAFSSHGEATTGLILQTDPASMTAEGMLVDLDGLIATLEDRRAALDEGIQGNPEGSVEGQALVNLASSGSQSDQLITTLEERLRELKARLVVERGREEKLTRTRELAWETYKELQTKEAELWVALQSQGSEVALAAPAAVPNQDTISGGRTVLLAGIVGLMLGIGGAYLIEFWWGYKDIELRPIKFRDLFWRN